MAGSVPAGRCVSGSRQTRLPGRSSPGKSRGPACLFSPPSVRPQPSIFRNRHFPKSAQPLSRFALLPHPYSDCATPQRKGSLLCLLPEPHHPENARHWSAPRNTCWLGGWTSTLHFGNGSVRGIRTVSLVCFFLPGRGSQSCCAEFAFAIGPLSRTQGLHVLPL